MNKYIKKAIFDLVSPHGFVYKKEVFLRVENDLVQGFTVRSKKAGIYTLFEVFFATYPLCHPDANFYNYFFEHRELSHIRERYEYWPYGYVTATKEGLEECVNKLITRISETLLPYFEKYCNCIIASDGLPELSGYNGSTIHDMYFALKTNKREAAIANLISGIQQREDARDYNAKRLSAEALSEKLIRSKRYDEQDQGLIEFITRSTDEEIEDFLLKNEEKALEFLGITR